MPGARAHSISHTMRMRTPMRLKFQGALYLEHKARKIQLSNSYHSEQRKRNIMSGGMECLIGIKFDDFVILAHDNSAGRSIVMMKQDQDKLIRLDDRLGMVLCGEAGDTVYFGEYIQKNVTLYRMRNGYALTPHAAANYTRKELAESIRSRNPKQVNLLLGGYDTRYNKSHLYYMDYLGTMADVPYAAHGYGSFFILGILDRLHRPNMTRSEGIDLLEKCVREIHQRFMINLASFSYYIISNDGFSERSFKNIADWVIPSAATGGTSESSGSSLTTEKKPSPVATMEVQ